MSASTDTGPLVYQSFAAKALGMTWSEARAFLVAQGVPVYPRGASLRTWAVAASDWDRIATAVGATTPALADASMARSVERANLALGRRARPASRRRSSGSRSQFA